MSAWYEGCRALIEHEYLNGYDRLYAVTLLDAVNALKLQDDSPEYHNAAFWFYMPYSTNLSLYTVCHMLNLNMHRVQRLAFQLEEQVMLERIMLREAA